MGGLLEEFGQGGGGGCERVQTARISHLLEFWVFNVPAASRRRPLTEGGWGATGWGRLDWRVKWRDFVAPARLTTKSAFPARALVLTQPPPPPPLAAVKTSSMPKPRLRWRRHWSATWA